MFRIFRRCCSLNTWVIGSQKCVHSRKCSVATSCTFSKWSRITGLTRPKPLGSAAQLCIACFETIRPCSGTPTEVLGPTPGSEVRRPAEPACEADARDDILGGPSNDGHRGPISNFQFQVDATAPT